MGVAASTLQEDTTRLLSQNPNVCITISHLIVKVHGSRADIALEKPHTRPVHARDIEIASIAKAASILTCLHIYVLHGHTLNILLPHPL